MRIVVQLVKEASVEIDKKIISKISEGELLLVGFKVGDTEKTVDRLIEKLLKLRIFSDGIKTNDSIFAVNREILAVSQFTLYADVKDGNRPSFTKCMSADSARILFDYFSDKLKRSFSNVKFGVFQADMKVSLINDGPFTILLDSEELGYV